MRRPLFPALLPIGDDDLDVTVLDGQALLPVLETVCQAGHGKHPSGVADGSASAPEILCRPSTSSWSRPRRSGVIGEVLQEVEPGRLRASRHEQLGAAVEPLI